MWGPGGVVSGQGGRMSRVAPLRGGFCRGLRAPGRRCCTFARDLRWQKPRNHAETKSQRWSRSRSHVRRPPSAHTGARRLNTTTNGKAHDPEGKRPPPRSGAPLPCATPEKTTPIPHAHASTRPLGGNTRDPLKTGRHTNPARSPDEPDPIITAQSASRSTRHCLPTSNTPHPRNRPTTHRAPPQT